MLTRLKRIIRLSKYDEPVLERMDSLAVSIEEHNAVGVFDEGFVDDVLTKEVEAVKGEYLPDMTESEVLAYERNERLGWKKFKLPWQHESSEQTTG